MKLLPLSSLTLKNFVKQIKHIRIIYITYFNYITKLPLLTPMLQPIRFLKYWNITYSPHFTLATITSRIRIAAINLSRYTHYIPTRFNLLPEGYPEQGLTTLALSRYSSSTDYNFNPYYVLYVSIWEDPDKETYATELASLPIDDDWITELDQTTHSNILIFFGLGITDNLALNALHVDYDRVTRDFTEYVNHVVQGRPIGVNNIYPNFIDEICTSSVENKLRVFVERLRELYPLKTFKYILVPEQDGQHTERINYIMNIGCTGYTPVYCNVMDNEGIHPDEPLHLNDNPGIAYKQCLDTLKRIDYSTLGERIFLVFHYPGYYDNFFEKDERLANYQNFRLELTDYVNCILYDLPSKENNHFHQANLAWYTLPTKDTSEPEWAKPINVKTTYGRKLIDKYVKKLKAKFPSKVIKYIVLPYNLEFQSIILNIGTSGSNWDIGEGLILAKIIKEDYTSNSTNSIEIEPLKFLASSKVLRESFTAVKPSSNKVPLTRFESKNIRHTYIMKTTCDRCMGNPFMCGCCALDPSKQNSVVGNLTKGLPSKNDPSLQTYVLNSKHLANGTPGQQNFVVHPRSVPVRDGKRFQIHKVHNAYLQKEKHQAIIFNEFVKLSNNYYSNSSVKAELKQDRVEDQPKQNRVEDQPKHIRVKAEPKADLPRKKIDIKEKRFLNNKEKVFETVEKTSIKNKVEEIDEK